ncbi:MAG: CoA transferase [Acidimicrobiales bacterium]
MMLSPYRVIDCTDERGQLAGFMLAQLGADVVLVEPPSGSPARHLPPFAGEQPDPERGLWHWAYNRGKRSVTADLSTPTGRERLAALAAGADVLLWTGRPGEEPFDRAALEAANPGLVIVAMTPFGLHGPKARWAATDLTIGAASCSMSLTGEAELPPLRWGSPQAWLHGAADMAVAALIALQERARSGRGQLADVSAQVSCLQASFCYAINRAWQWPAMRRSGDGIDFGVYKIRWTYPALDGEVSITFSFGAALAHYTVNLFRWIWEEGGCHEADRDIDFVALSEGLFDGSVPPSEALRLGDIVTRFTSRHTKAHLASEATRRKVLLAPISTLAEVLDNGHLADRRFWDEVRHPDADRPHRYPGRFVVASDAPLAVLGPAPQLGSHDGADPWQPRTAAAPAAVGVAPATAGAGADGPSANGANGSGSGDGATGANGSGSGSGDGAGTTNRNSGAADGPALDGLRVLDLAWSVAGPYVGRTLADFGATVVKVENRVRPDLTRTTSPFHPGNAEVPMEGSGLFANCNAGKLGIELDLTDPADRETMWDLVRWADVMVESFSAGALDRMGFGYEAVSAANPGIILLSSCLPGQTGTLDMPGLGNLTTALFGFTTTTRWPGRSACGPFGAYTDIVSPRFGLAALLAALDHRRRTGQGQHLDLSQAESSMHLQAPALLDAEVNGRPFEGRGNRDLVLAPHGVYRSRLDTGIDGQADPEEETEAWVAVACGDDAQWAALAGWLGRPELSALSAAERHARQDELDALIGARTADLDATVVQDELQALGVAAHRVQNTAGCLSDPQLAHREHYRTVEHPLLGPVVVEGPRFHLSRTPARIATPGPTYNQHGDVVRHLLAHAATPSPGVGSPGTPAAPARTV